MKVKPKSIRRPLKRQPFRPIGEGVTPEYGSKRVSAARQTEQNAQRCGGEESLAETCLRPHFHGLLSLGKSWRCAGGE